jgi:hypothetical protein
MSQPEDHKPKLHHCENLKPRTTTLWFTKLLWGKFSQVSSLSPVIFKQYFPCEISGSHGSKYEV